MPAHPAWLGLGTALAFSPALAELAAHWLREPWSRYSLVFLPLWVDALLRTRAGSRPAPRAGGVAVLGGVAIQLLAFAGGVARAARVGLVVGAVGLCRALGAGTLRAALLAAWIVPLPSALVRASSPGAESALARAGAGLVRALGGAVTPHGARLEGPAGALRLEPGDAGALALALATGLAWWIAARRQLSGRATALLLATAVAVALPAQLAAVAAAAALTAGGSPAAGRALLSHAPWLALLATAALLAYRREKAVTATCRG